MNIRELPVPEFKDPDHIRRMANSWSAGHDMAGFLPMARAFGRKHGIRPAHEDKRRVVLWGIDLQRDFCHPQGSLFVSGSSGMGAVDDSIRLSGFIYRNLDRITEILLTMDTHTLFQVFFAPFWETEDGGPLSEHTLITLSPCGSYLVNTDLAGAVLHERVRPVEAAAVWTCGGDREWLFSQVLFYCRKLAEAGKYTLYLWPPHCISGTEGHCTSGVVQEAVMFHNLVRMSKPCIYEKGRNLLTENYDPAEAEITDSWDGTGNIAPGRDSRFYEELAASHAVIVAGQAKSHCVMSMLEGLMREALKRDATQLGKVHILTDCMSPVVVRDEAGNTTCDFTAETDRAFARFRDAGMHLTDTCNMQGF